MNLPHPLPSLTNSATKHYSLYRQVTSPLSAREINEETRLYHTPQALLISKKYLRLQIRELIRLKPNSLGPPLPIFEPDLIPLNYSRKHQFLLISSKPPARTSMSSTAELQMCLGDGGKLVLVRVFLRGQAGFVDTETVEILEASGSG